MALTVLATSEAYAIPLFVLVAAIGLLQVIFGGLFNSRLRKLESMEDRITQQAERLVEQKIEALESHDERVNERLTFGEGEFQRLRDDDHKLQLEVLSRLDRLNERLDQRFATNADLRRVEERVSRLEGKTQRQTD
ncbi:hypothetical protein [Humisphaera borealis]|uniref:DUF2746 domain-containing protein n=1 Tax=Humisphaera borealis TaxID=2807512 RepID=A0A7M2X0G1_9BACT|nr:hypothetical protein [Humisphaera borealis]QOV90902.1 hypothetical protein IPV69_05950 [Humisphaera borealis]